MNQKLSSLYVFSLCFFSMNIHYIFCIIFTIFFPLQICGWNPGLSIQCLVIRGSQSTGFLHAGILHTTQDRDLVSKLKVPYLTSDLQVKRSKVKKKSSNMSSTAFHWIWNSYSNRGENLFIGMYVKLRATDCELGAPF